MEQTSNKSLRESNELLRECDEKRRRAHSDESAEYGYSRKNDELTIKHKTKDMGLRVAMRHE